MLKMQKDGTSVKDDRFLNMMKRAGSMRNQVSLNDSSDTSQNSYNENTNDYFTRFMNQIRALGTITEQMIKDSSIVEQDKRKNMIENVEEFAVVQNDLRRLKEEVNMEAGTISRLLKNEVIDMAERLQRVETSMSGLEKNLRKLGKTNG